MNDFFEHIESPQARGRKFDLIFEGQTVLKFTDHNTILLWIAKNPNKNFSVESYRHNVGTNAEWIDRRIFTFKANEQTPPATQSIKKEMEAEDKILYAIAKNELEFYKKFYARLESELSELKEENQRLRAVNISNEARIATFDHEKQLALTQQLIDNKPKGLGSILEQPDAFEKIGNLIVTLRQPPQALSPAKNYENKDNLSEEKREAFNFIKKYVQLLSDEQLNKFSWVIKHMVENTKIDTVYQQWTKKESDPAPVEEN